ncbi:flagellar motor switch protein FliN [Microbulbifer thermotolerans]|uniref:Flagellar motor switch protein FliN n=1 Tax=Microbulbifer thermotolerans TaxID=252514 RepID=A0A143HNV5_MICTH|nr:flagellar motor switch protein FliN [Microbulbifer thermotolerans]AMX03177.1 flagellar motor switch protein FliN [Microbulbifer thermotolerans]SFC62017.1 flagellar motor switch protein FliN/FliY [Microbulbifer thermotolerans]
MSDAEKTAENNAEEITVKENTTEDSWAAAMTEQLSDADPWSEALAEQGASAASADTAARSVGEQIFKPLEQGDGSTAARDLEMVMDIPVKLSVELGRTRITIKQLLELAQGSVIELDGLAGEPMDILINGYLIAQGEVVVVDDKYGIRITEIITPQERVQKLNR